MKTFELRLTFHLILFPRVKLAIFQHCIRWWLGADQSGPMMFSLLTRICVTRPQWVKASYPTAINQVSIVKTTLWSGHNCNLILRIHFTLEQCKCLHDLEEFRGACFELIMRVINRWLWRNLYSRRWIYSFSQMMLTPCSLASVSLSAIIFSRKSKSRYFRPRICTKGYRIQIHRRPSQVWEMSKSIAS